MLLFSIIISYFSEGDQVQKYIQIDSILVRRTEVSKKTKKTETDAIFERSKDRVSASSTYDADFCGISTFFLAVALLSAFKLWAPSSSDSSAETATVATFLWLRWWERIFEVPLRVSAKMIGFFEFFSHAVQKKKQWISLPFWSVMIFSKSNASDLFALSFAFNTNEPDFKHARISSIFASFCSFVDALNLSAASAFNWSAVFDLYEKMFVLKY